MSIKKHFTNWKPPSHKALQITSQDDLITDKIIDVVDKYYYKNVRCNNSGYETPITLYERGSRINDDKNNPNAKYEIHNFGCSWTYGWCLEQKDSFPHLLIEEDIASFNYGAGRTGLDYAVKKVSEVYEKRNHRENRNFIYVITIPHTFRRMFIEDSGMARRSIEKPTAALINEYNHYLYFLHHYEMLNRLVGKDRIIWGTWDNEVPENKLDIFFELHDLASDDRHPGLESHKIYAEKIKNVIKERNLFK